MEDDSIAFGLHTGTFQSLFDGVEETTSFSDSALGGVTVSDKGFFPDLGLPYDGEFHFRKIPLIDVGWLW